MSEIFALFRHALAGLRVLIAATVVCGLAYPLVVTGIAQGVLPWRADGSLLTASGAHTTDPAHAVGSALIGQETTGLFYPRPSAAGDGYDMESSYGSNLGPEDPRLIKLIKQRQARIARREEVPIEAVPADAVTASASGLDPDISPAYAAIQVRRVASVTCLSQAKVRALVAANTHGRELGFLGAASVNVLRLNIAVRKAAH